MDNRLLIDSGTLRQILALRVSEAANVTDWCRKNGYFELRSVVSKFLRGDVDASNAVAEMMGYERVIMWVKVKDDPEGVEARSKVPDLPEKGT